MLVSKTTFQAVFPKAKTGIYEAIDKVIEQAGCKTKAQQAMFLAQCGHETAGFTVFSENLNYSATALVRTFPRHFDESTAAIYAKQAVKIANRAYANRMGNGDEASGHGYKYRGRGLIQITGRANYIEFEKWLGRDITPDEVATDLNLIVLTGVWYWQKHKLAEYSSVYRVTQIINGGTNGLTDRERKYHKLKA